MKKVRACWFFMFILYVFSLFAGYAYAGQIFLWNKNEFGSITPIHLTIGYSTRDEGYSLTQAEIVEILKHYAVGVYEMTNGTHRLGRIKILELGSGIASSDQFIENYNIWWNPPINTYIKPGIPPNFVDWGPRANNGTYIPYSQNGVGQNNKIVVPNRFLFEGDRFNEISGTLNNMRMGGYALAHETAHYIYGIFDEYQLDSSSVEGLPKSRDISIMKNPNASLLTSQTASPSVLKPGSAKWLNFSTEYNYQGADYNNEQKTLFGVSGWDAIKKKNLYPNFTYANLEYRKYWFEDLVSAAPNPNGANFDLSHEGDWYRLEYGEYELPQQGAPDADFFPTNPNPSNPFQLPAVEFGSPKRARIYIFDRTSAILPDVKGKTAHLLGPVVFNVIKDISEFYKVYKDQNIYNHIGVYAYGANGLEPIIPLAEMSGTVIKSRIEYLLNRAKAIEEETPSQGEAGSVMNGKLYDALNDALDILTTHMGNNDIILGDIKLLTGGSDSGSSKAFEDIRTISRSQFIPIKVTLFGATSADVENVEPQLKRLALNTGGGDPGAEAVEKIVHFSDRQSLSYVDKYAYINAKNRFMKLEPYTGIKQLADPMEFYLTDPSRAASITGNKNLTDKTVRRIPILGYGLPYIEEFNDLEADTHIAARKAQYSAKKYFNVNSSIQSLSIMLAGTSADPDFSVTLTKPNGTTASFQEGLNISDEYWGGMKSINVDIAGNDAGKWSIELANGTDEDCVVVAAIYGNAGSVDNAYYNSVQIGSAPAGVYDKSANGEYVGIFASTSRGGYRYSGIKHEMEVFDPEGDSHTLSMKDDGKNGDSKAGDGVYFGRIKADKTGRYLLRSSASNDGNVKISRLSRMSGEKDDSPTHPGADEFVYSVSDLEFEVIESPKGDNTSALAEDGQNNQGANSGCDSGTPFALGIALVMAIAAIIRRKATRS